MRKRKSFFKNPFFTSTQLARRWNMNSATLRQWKWFNKGPQFQKIGGRILYKRELIEDFENNLIRAHTTEDGNCPVESISQLLSEDSPKNEGE